MNREIIQFFGVEPSCRANRRRNYSPKEDGPFILLGGPRPLVVVALHEVTLQPGLVLSSVHSTTQSSVHHMLAETETNEECALTVASRWLRCSAFQTNCWLFCLIYRFNSIGFVLGRSVRVACCLSFNVLQGCIGRVRVGPPILCMLCWGLATSHFKLPAHRTAAPAGGGWGLHTPCTPTCIVLHRTAV